MAYRRGEDSEQAMVGALLEAAAFSSLRDLAAVAVGLTKKGARRG